LAPRTAARSQPRRPTLCLSRCRRRTIGATSSAL
jgi:hypothetical protein